MNQATTRTKRTRRKPSPPAVEAGQQAAVELAPYDDTLLECARTQWQFGDWESLARTTPESRQHLPQRHKLALLAATGHFQLGNSQEEHQFIRLAEDWGCSRRLIAQMLISGKHNALAHTTVILEQPSRAKEHFRHAVTLGGIAGDLKLLTEARASRYFDKIKTVGM